MRSSYKPPDEYAVRTDTVYRCNHPYYNSCTLLKMDDKGLAVIQQRFNKRYKWTWWGPIDPWLVDDIVENSRFSNFFLEHSGCKDENGLYPTITVRKLMWALRMKPLTKEIWETRF